MADLSVVILTWNDAPDMLRAAESVVRSVGVTAEVIVVDNGSLEPAKFPNRLGTTVRLDENVGVGAGRNVGAQYATTDIICFLDSDAVLEPTCLAMLVAGIQSGAGLVAPVFAGQPPAVSAGRSPSIARKIARAVGLTDRYRRETAAPTGDPAGWDVEFAIGACQVVRSDAFEQVGGFTVADLFGPEDVELCDALRKAGWSIRQIAGAECNHVARRGHRRLMSRSGVRHAKAVAGYYRRRWTRAS